MIVVAVEVGAGVETTAVRPATLAIDAMDDPMACCCVPGDCRGGGTRAVAMTGAVAKADKDEGAGVSRTMFLCVLICAVRWEFCAKALPHTEHSKGRSFVCVRIWSTRWPAFKL